MKIAGIQFPDTLIDALRDKKLVVFAGAGVSMGEPANLPSFSELSSLIARGTGEVRDAYEPEDRLLGRLQHQGVNVDARALQHLSKNETLPTDLHRDLLRFFTIPDDVRIVTTNFDMLFETAAQDVFDMMPQVFHAPALPQASRFSGIVHVHGSINQPGEMVLTDARFGRAYLTEGWARRFLLELFRNFTVLFVGYSYDDVVMNYLTRALPVTDQGLRFILTDGNNPQQWQLLGIEPVEFPMPDEHDYSALYEGVRRLGDFVRRNILDWQREITEIASNPPPLAGEESDKIIHALKEVPTTRFFTNTAKSAEWITWLDKQNWLFVVRCGIERFNVASFGLIPQGVTHDAGTANIHIGFGINTAMEGGFSTSGYG